MMHLPNGKLAAAVLSLLATSATAAEFDVFDRAVPFGQGRPTVTLLANTDSADAVSDPMAKLSFALRDLNPVVIVRVDLRSLPGMMHGIARMKMRGNHEAGLENFRRECAHARVPVPPDIGKGLFFVPDGDGLSAKAAGLKKNFATSIAIVSDGAGREVARGPFPAESKALQKALRRALAKPAATPVAATPVKVTPKIVAPKAARRTTSACCPSASTPAGSRRRE